MREESSVVEVVHFADPWCWWSWGLEPVLQRLKAVYGDQIMVKYKMGGMTDDVSDWRKHYDVESDDALRNWISESSSITGVPASPDCYIETGVRSTWPACEAVKAAQLQGEEIGERFYRRLMEVILLQDRNGSDAIVYLAVAKEVGVDVAAMKRDIGSGKASKLFQVDSKDMNVGFTTLTHRNKITGETLNVDGKFNSKDHEAAVEKLSEGKLAKKTPIDILEYFENHMGDTVFPKEISEVFATSPEDAELRMRKLEDAGFLNSRSFRLGAKGWTFSPDASKKQLTTEQVSISHVTSNAQVARGAKLDDIITGAVVNLYTQVATDPHRQYHFPLGKEALRFVGYEEKDIGKLPEISAESFAGVGNPHSSGAIRLGNTVLDIGSGSGTDVLVSSLRTGPSGKVFGLDITDAMIEKAKKGIAEMGAKNVRILKGNATKIPLEDASVDVVTSNGVLNLVPDKKKAFEEIFRVLKAGGRLQVADIIVEKDVQKVCGLVPQLWADCIGGAAVGDEYLETIKGVGFVDIRTLRSFDYFAASGSENTKRLTKAFGAKSTVITAVKPA